jgi:1A family penicillin-binding protein
MWDISAPRKRFYRRPWFLVPFCLFVSVGLVGFVYGLGERAKLQAKAATFDYSRLEEMESATVIYDRNGVVLGRMFTQNRDQVKIDQLSPALLKAVVAAEDARFYQHRGVDYKGIVRAVVKNYQSGKKMQGASTLAQQLARNTFPDMLPPQEKSYQRKLLELAVAQEIEKRCTKQKILELYLNRVFFGSGFYGAEAAARGYFGKSAKDLTLSEAAMLCGLLKSPSNLSPWKNRDRCIESRNYVLQRAMEIGLITAQEREETLKQDIIVKNRRPIHQESYAADLVAQQVAQKVGRDSAVSDGYRIYTTIDSGLQKTAEKVMREQLDAVERHEGFEGQTASKFDIEFKQHQRQAAAGDAEPEARLMPEYLQGGVVVLDNSNGGILALVGGRDFAHSPYNRAISARRPPGTAFKPLVYAAAFEKGLFPGTQVKDAVMDNRQVMIGGESGILGEWGPERVDNKYEGSISARTALVKSKNAATVRLGMETGLEATLALAKQAGIETPLRKFPATFLGSSEVTLMELTLANTMFPNGGWRPEKPFIVTRIEDKSGRVVYRAERKKVQVVKPSTAHEINTCLAEVLERGTADKTYTELGVKKFPLGGKTGTAYNFTDAWFVGYSSAVTCGVWTGFDKPRTPIYRGAFSNEIALPIWAGVMKATFAAYNPKEFPEPKGMIKCEICSTSGQLATDKCVEFIENKDTGEKVKRRTTYLEICTEEQAPREGCSVHGGGGGGTFVKEVKPGETPRAELAVDVSKVQRVLMKAPTVLGNDPYNSSQSIKNAVAMGLLNGQVAPVDSSVNIPVVAAAPGDAAPVEPEVRRAEPVRPMQQQTAVIDTTIKLDPPPPIEF